MILQHCDTFPPQKYRITDGNIHGQGGAHVWMERECRLHVPALIFSAKIQNTVKSFWRQKSFF